MSSIVVTGGRGFVGRVLVRRLVEQASGATIVSVGRRAPVGESRAIELQADLTRRESWDALPGDVTHVVHLAAVLPGAVDQPVTGNVDMARHLAGRISSWPAMRAVVYASSISVYGSPEGELREEVSPSTPNEYGRSKLEAEGLIATVRVRNVALRFSSVYGVGQSSTVLSTFLKRVRAGQALRVFGDGSRTQDFLYVEDAASAILLALRSERSGVFNIGSGRPTTMLELAHAVRREFGADGPPVQVDSSVQETSSSVRVRIDRARRDLGYEPRFGLEEGLKHYRRSLDTPGRA